MADVSWLSIITADNYWIIATDIVGFVVRPLLLWSDDSFGDTGLCMSVENYGKRD